MADFLLAAWLGWRTPLPAALSSLRLAAWSSSAALSLSPAAAASRNFRMAVFTEDLTALLRWRRASLVLMRLIWDLMLATRGLLSVRDLSGLPYRGVLQRPRMCGLPPGRNATRYD